MLSPSPHRYEAAVDGIRAIAVTSVVLYHSGVPGFTGGYVGVDVFFVISGYLISGLLAAEHETTGRIALLAFYARRVRRLLPAMLLMMLTIFGLSALVLEPALGEPQRLAWSAMSTLLLQANHYFWLYSGGYFDGASDEQVFLHMWSLAVEEQFYLVWPLLLWLILKFTRGSARVLTCCALWVCSFAGSQLLLAHDPASSFFLAPPRAWELLTGAILALTTLGTGDRGVARFDAFFTWAGLAAIAGSIFLFSDATAFPGYAALLPVLGTAALLRGVQGRHPSVALSVLSSWGAVTVGLLSYSWYLWHWPLLALLRVYTLGAAEVPMRVATVGVALALAALSYRYVEQPFRRAAWSRTAGSGKTVSVGALASLSLVLMAVGVGYLSKASAVQRMHSPLYHAALSATYIPIQGEACALGTDQGVVSNCDLTSQKAVLVIWGDSHARALRPFARRYAKAQGLGFVEMSTSGCPSSQGFFLPEDPPALQASCIGKNERVLKKLESGVVFGRPVARLLIASRRIWSWSKLDEKRNQRYSKESFASRNPRLDSGLESALRRIEKSPVQSVVLVAPMPELRNFSSRCLVRAKESWCAMPRSLFDSKRQTVMANLERLSLTLPRVTLFDPADFMCDAVACPVRRNGVVLYGDDNHISVAGAEALFDWFKDGQPHSEAHRRDAVGSVIHATNSADEINLELAPPRLSRAAT